MAFDHQPLPRRASAHRRAADTLTGFCRTASSASASTPASIIPEDDDAPQSSSDSAFFLESQVGDMSVMTYCYTDDPWRLLFYDVFYFFQYVWALPWTVLPLRPFDSGHLSEFAPTRANVFCLAMHAVLVVLQLGFVVALPFGLLVPVWMLVAGVAAFMLLNRALCATLNGRGTEFHSDPEYAEARPEHAHEQWVFLNGVAAGQHFLKSNLNRLALTFGRPVLGIHNKTSGVIFDVVECLVQRNFGYATNDVRACYAIIKQKLYDARFSKIVFICHSQGGIEGGLVLDWLLQELPQDLLAKLEVYTFGSAANHFNNPYRHESSQRLAREDPPAAEGTRTAETTETAEKPPQTSPADKRLPPLKTDASSLDVRTSSAAHDRVLGHVEHYAHTTDFVAIWGILHFVRRRPASPTIPRFVGRVFVRSSERGGHQLVQHYLDGMFPLERDCKGRLVGAAESNVFMESDVQHGVVGGPLYETIGMPSVMGDHDEEDKGDALVAEVYGTPSRTRTLKVKDLSRLWLYRNGKVPAERGVSRMSTI